MNNYKLVKNKNYVSGRNIQNKNFIKFKMASGILFVSLTMFTIANSTTLISNTQNVIYNINEVFDDSNNIENLDNITKETLKEFNNKLSSNIPNIYLKNYFNNIKDLKVYNNNNDLNKFIKQTKGYYSIKSNRLVNISSDKHTMFHELIHMASSNSKYSGFSNGKDAVGLTEGYTEYLVKTLFPDHYISYPKEVQIVKILNSIIGKDKMKQYYFTNDLESFKNDLSNIYGTQKDTDKLINLLDLYNKNNDKQKLREIACLLLKYCYSHQQKQESNLDIDTDIRILIYNLYSNDNFNQIEEKIKEEISLQKKFN